MSKIVPSDMSMLQFKEKNSKGAAVLVNGNWFAFYKPVTKLKLSTRCSRYASAHPLVGQFWNGRIKRPAYAFVGPRCRVDFVEIQKLIKIQAVVATGIERKRHTAKATVLLVGKTQSQILVG